MYWPRTLLDKHRTIFSVIYALDINKTKKQVTFFGQFLSKIEICAPNCLYLREIRSPYLFRMKLFVKHKIGIEIYLFFSKKLIVCIKHFPFSRLFFSSGKFVVILLCSVETSYFIWYTVKAKTCFNTAKTFLQLETNQNIRKVTIIHRMETD